MMTVTFTSTLQILAAERMSHVLMRLSRQCLVLSVSWRLITSNCCCCWHRYHVLVLWWQQHLTKHISRLYHHTLPSHTLCTLWQQHQRWTSTSPPVSRVNICPVTNRATWHETSSREKPTDTGLSAFITQKQVSSRDVLQSHSLSLVLNTTTPDMHL